MPARIATLRRILDSGVAAVIRAKSSEHLIRVADAIKAGGVDCIEVTMTTPDALQVIAEVSARYGDEVLIGVGTVLDPETARAAILAGAEFVVGPTLNLDVIRMAHRYDKVVLPGAYTPTEILTAWEHGADLVKVFPAGSLGPGFFKDVRGPLPQVRMVPTGGVDLTTAGAFIKAGAAALCVGTAMMPSDAIAAGDFGKVTELAAEFVRIVREARGA
jgi:2-dehydro-3-deoxyphosphogluconate aldolase / (4S)-4-hydroxy-2-oxoglutarate aldolase